jgi:hypothetical protein
VAQPSSPLFANSEGHPPAVRDRPEEQRNDLP